MLQKHQLFVLAQINGAYRTLAAIHHRSKHAYIALDRCVRLLKIFDGLSNTLPLKGELAIAGNKSKSFWLGGEDGTTAPDFPFIETCLWTGALRDTTDHVKRCERTLGLDDGDDSAGITILDITTPRETRYAFAFKRDLYTCNFPGHNQVLSLNERNEEIARLNVEVIPNDTILSASSYISAYYDPVSRDSKFYLKEIEKYPLINETFSALRGVHQPAMSTAPITLASLRSMMMEQTVQQALLGNIEPEFLDIVEQLHDFSAREMVHLMRCIISAEQHVDFSLFPWLSPMIVLEMLSGERKCPVSAINLSGNQNINGNTVKSILKMHTQIHAMVLFATKISRADLQSTNISSIYLDEEYSAFLRYNDADPASAMPEDKVPPRSTSEWKPPTQIFRIYNFGDNLQINPRRRFHNGGVDCSFRDALIGRHMNASLCEPSQLPKEPHPYGDVITDPRDESPRCLAQRLDEATTQNCLKKPRDFIAAMRRDLLNDLDGYQGPGDRWSVGRALAVRFALKLQEDDQDGQSEELQSEYPSNDFRARGGYKIDPIPPQAFNLHSRTPCKEIQNRPRLHGATGCWKCVLTHDFHEVIREENGEEFTDGRLLVRYAFIRPLLPPNNRGPTVQCSSSTDRNTPPSEHRTPHTLWTRTADAIAATGGSFDGILEIANADMFFLPAGTDGADEGNGATTPSDKPRTVPATSTPTPRAAAPSSTAKANPISIHQKSTQTSTSTSTSPSSPAAAAAEDWHKQISRSLCSDAEIVAAVRLMAQYSVYAGGSVGRS
ncbi:MAG: hypothetical protein M1831_006929 [Alyxoria varia]|nr:MAG: hypothetical protein M1831_006929 [Alyxoria varia]